MKNNRFFRILAVAVVLSLLMIAVLATPALAASVALSPTTGVVGATVTVSGSGYTASTTVYVYFSSDDADLGDEIDYEVDTYKQVKTVSLSSTTLSTTFTVPTTMTGGDDDEDVTSGDYYVYVTYSTDDYIIAVDDFTVIAGEIELDDSSGYVGDTVTVSGTDFADNSDITVYFDTATVAITDGDETTSSSGDFECTFEVPAAVRGSHTVKVEDEDDNSDTATYTVSQKITLNPTSGSSATTVTITGTGFRASHSITVTYDDVGVTIKSGNTSTNSKGGFECTFDVPARDAGTYDVVVSDGSYPATASFTYTTSATISPVTTAAAPGYVGDTLTITGVGFTPNATITVTYATAPVTLATVTADGSGNFTAPITIPPSVAGAHTITVQDGSNTSITKLFTFYMEADAPDAPVPTLPAEAEKLEEGTFDWGDVTDDSTPVTYSLQVSTDSTFATPLVNKTGLSTSTYTLSEEEKLESTGKDAPYYWQVRAVDAASNPSAWSSAGTFTVGLSIEISGIAWIIIAAAAVVFFIIGLLVGRRGGGGGYY